MHPLPPAPSLLPPNAAPIFLWCLPLFLHRRKTRKIPARLLKQPPVQGGHVECARSRGDPRAFEGPGSCISRSAPRADVHFGGVGPARGEELRIGGKALLLKGDDDQYRLFVLPADRKLDSAALRKRLGFKRLRFANAEELKELTGLVPGSVPPFGRPILPFDLYLDEAIRQNERIAFNAGSLTDSIILPMADYLRIAQPNDCFAFSSLP